MKRPTPVVVTVTYPLYDSIKYLEYKGYGEYDELISLAHSIKNQCGRDSVLHVDVENTLDECYFEGDELKLMQALVREFEITDSARFDENY